MNFTCYYQIRIIIIIINFLLHNFMPFFIPKEWGGKKKKTKVRFWLVKHIFRAQNKHYIKFNELQT